MSDELTEEKKIKKNWFIDFLITVAIVVSLSFVITICVEKKLANEKSKIYEQGYIDACKDFYKGKLKYDLIENEDGTREWKRIETNKIKNIVFQHGDKKHGVQVK